MKKNWVRKEPKITHNMEIIHKLSKTEQIEAKKLQ